MRRNVRVLALPKADDAKRALTGSLTAAGQVAKLRNDYRYRPDET
ncbi:hypothetical protein ACIOGT_25080 [Streptomyces microflavus]